MPGVDAGGSQQLGRRADKVAAERERIVGRVEVEHRRRAERGLTKPGVARGEGVAVGRDADQPGDRQREQHRLLDLAVARAGFRIAARLGVGQDRADYRFEVAAGAAAVIGKDRGDAADIGGAGVGCDQLADQRPRYERRCRGVVENGVDDTVDAGVGAGPGGDGDAEEGLGGRVVLRRYGRHRLGIIDLIIVGRGRAGEAGVGPPG